MESGSHRLREVLQLLQVQAPRLGLKSLHAYLYVAGQPGCRVMDLARGCGFDMATASRSVRALGPADAAWALPPASGWVDQYQGASDGRERLLFLSAEGRRLLRVIEGVLAGAADEESVEARRPTLAATWEALR